MDVHVFPFRIWWYIHMHFPRGSRKIEWERNVETPKTVDFSINRKDPDLNYYDRLFVKSWRGTWVCMRIQISQEWHVFLSIAMNRLIRRIWTTRDIQLEWYQVIDWYLLSRVSHCQPQHSVIQKPNSSNLSSFNTKSSTTHYQVRSWKTLHSPRKVRLSTIIATSCWAYCTIVSEE
jgi:hypothetical protein